MPENTENVPFCVKRATEELETAHRLEAERERTPWWRVRRREETRRDAAFALYSAIWFVMSQRDIDHAAAQPLYSVRKAIAETDLPPDTGSAEAIRELWARLQRAHDLLMMVPARVSAPAAEKPNPILIRTLFAPVGRPDSGGFSR